LVFPAVRENCGKKFFPSLATRLETRQIRDLRTTVTGCEGCGREPAGKADSRRNALIYSDNTN
jgi:hypothetical protein